MSADRWFELCDLAKCMPDSPWLVHPGDRDAQLGWLTERLHREGHDIGADEVDAALTAHCNRPRGREHTVLSLNDERRNDDV